MSPCIEYIENTQLTGLYLLLPLYPPSRISHHTKSFTFFLLISTHSSLNSLKFTFDLRMQYFILQNWKLLHTKYFYYLLHETVNLRL